MQTIPIGSDHAGFQYKQAIVQYLEENGYSVKDVGPFSEDSVDYPDFAHPVAKAVNDGDFELGILICGSGEGVCMTANKHQNVRAALVWNSDIAKLSRQHNNANIICLPARFISEQQAIQFVDLFLTTAFEAGRHERRVNKIACS